MHQEQDNAAAIEAHRLQLGLKQTRGQRKDHFAEFPDKPKSDDELVAMFRKLGICNVSPQVLVKFAKWFEENPDFLYPGSRCVAVKTAENKLINGLREPDYATVTMTRADVSKEHMLAAISSVMSGLQQGTCRVTLKFDQSPKQFTMTDKYPLLVMHRCQRLISGSEHYIVAVHKDKLVFKETTIMIKRLPDEFHKQLKGYCECRGLFKEVTCRKVYEYTPGLVTSVLFRGQAVDGEPFCIRLRMTGAANKTFDFDSVRQERFSGGRKKANNSASGEKEGWEKFNGVH